MTNGSVLKLLRIGIGIGSLALAFCWLLAIAMAVSRLWGVLLEVSAGRATIEQELHLIGTVDLLLLGIGVLIIAAGIVNLAIRRISLPRGMQFADLHQLKSTFASFLILVMAITYLESLASLQSLERSTASNPIALLYGGLGFLAVTGGLILFQNSSKHSHSPHEQDQMDPLFPKNERPCQHSSAISRPRQRAVSGRGPERPSHPGWGAVLGVGGYHSCVDD
ncbi:MAG: YqhA family protein [Cyanobacteriota bacterium]|nr:YqhA family protein [Cyanobacteriota bacterium]